MTASIAYGWQLNAFQQNITKTELFSLLYVLSLLGILWLSVKMCGLMQSSLVSAITMCIGIGVSFISIPLGYNGDLLLAFDANMFFLLLLPPLICGAGFQMNFRIFASNFLTIMTYANLGTLISALSTGVLMYWFGTLGICPSVSFMDCLAFGSIISATDPVSTLSVFSDLNVDPNLNAIVLGTSVLDDAISIILFSTFLLMEDATFSSSYAVTTIVSYLLISVTASIIIGYILGILYALFILWNPQLRENKKIYFCCTLMFAYISFLSATILQISGIISCFFASLAFKRYNALYSNCKDAEELQTFIGIINLMCETIVFFAMGLSMFSCRPNSPVLPTCSEFSMSFTLLACVSIVICRILQIYPLALMLNCYYYGLAVFNCFTGAAVVNQIETTSEESYQKYLGKSPSPIDFSYQNILLFAGLRGPIAYATAQLLFLQRGGISGMIYNTTKVIVFFTVLVKGALARYVLKKCNVITGIDMNVVRKYQSNLPINIFTSCNYLQSQDVTDDGKCNKRTWKYMEVMEEFLLRIFDCVNTEEDSSNAIDPEMNFNLEIMGEEGHNQVLLEK